jgi:hypothetical protein
MPLSQPIKRLARSIVNPALERKRLAVESAIPKVKLRRENMANCRLLLDRDELLRQLPTGAVCAEIGVDQGEFTESILRATQPRELHLVDNWGSERYDESKFESVRSKFAEASARGQVHIHRRLSLDAVRDFSDEQFDWIYIDTTHAYELTANELRAYAPKVRRGGIIAGHDYVMGNWINGFRYGVVEAVHEFCVNEGWELIYLTVEQVENQSFAIRRIADASARPD